MSLLLKQTNSRVFGDLSKPSRSRSILCKACREMFTQIWLTLRYFICKWTTNKVLKFFFDHFHRNIKNDQPFRADSLKIRQFYLSWLMEEVSIVDTNRDWDGDLFDVRYQERIDSLSFWLQRNMMLFWFKSRSWSQQATKVRNGEAF
jgi:hypothetical protein